MGNIIRLALNNERPDLGGYDHFWEVILAKTTLESPSFTFHEIDGACHPGFEHLLRRFLRLLVRNGYVKVVAANAPFVPREYCLVKRQRSTPSFAKAGGISPKGQMQQNMWNVMRRERQGFTVPDLAVLASTDQLVVLQGTAKYYCRLLEQAGVLTIATRGKSGFRHHGYVLLGSANTGPKAPQLYRAKFIYDPNTGLVVGDAEATGISS